MSLILALPEELLAHPLELRPDRTVPDEVADLGDHAADERRILFPIQLDLLARCLLERSRDPTRNVVGERLGGRHGRQHASGVLVDHRAHLAGDHGKDRDALAVEQHAREVAGDRRDAGPLQDRVQERATLVGGERRAGERGGDLVVVKSAVAGSWSNAVDLTAALKAKVGAKS